LTCAACGREIDGEALGTQLYRVRDGELVVDVQFAVRSDGGVRRVTTDCFCVRCAVHGLEEAAMMLAHNGELDEAR
jgi:hypothetical protein